MTQNELLRNLFDSGGGRVMLRTLMESYLGASYRQRLTDLRRDLAGEGKTIVCHQVREEGRKGETYWEIQELQKQKYYTEPTGQTVMVLN